MDNFSLLKLNSNPLLWLIDEGDDITCNMNKLYHVNIASYTYTCKDEQHW